MYVEVVERVPWSGGADLLVLSGIHERRLVDAVPMACC